MGIRKVGINHLKAHGLLIHSTNKLDNVFPGALCVVGVWLYVILESLYACAAPLRAEVPAKIFSEDKRGIISTGQHQTNEEVVNGISQPFFNMSSGPVDSAGVVRGPEVNFLWIQIHAL